MSTETAEAEEEEAPTETLPEEWEDAEEKDETRSSPRLSKLPGVKAPPLRRRSWPSACLRTRRGEEDDIV